MSNVAKRDATHLTVSDQAQAAANQDVIASDILIPRLLLMQGISPLVTQRKAALGEIVRSTTVEKLGDPEHPVNIVPIKITNSWTNYEILGTKPEFRSSEPRNAGNETLEWEFEKDGAKWIRRKTITLYALVPSDVAAYEAEIKKAAKEGLAPDLNRTVMPVVITFQSTSFKHAGKKIASFFNTVRVNSRRVPGLAPYHYQLPLSCKEEKSQKGMYFVYDLGAAVAIRDAEVIKAAEQWSENLNVMNIKTDDSGEVADVDSGDSSTLI